LKIFSELVLTRVGTAAQRIGRKNDGVATRAKSWYPRGSWNRMPVTCCVARMAQA